MAATTAAVVGIVSGVAGTAMSFAQAAKQQQNIRSAQAKADQAMQEARKKLEVNFYDQLSLPKQEIENARIASLVQGAQALSPELGRAAAATAGRVQMAQNEAQAGITAAAEKQLFELDKMSATEESRLRDIGIQLDMGEIAGAQQAMSDAEQAKAAAMAQGFQGIGQTAQAVSSAVPLYQQSAGTKALMKSEAAYNKAAANNTLPAAFMQNGKPMSYQQAAGMVLNNPNLGTMQTPAFEDFMIGKGRDYISGIDFMNYTGQPMQQRMTQSQLNMTPGLGVLQNYPTKEYNPLNIFDFNN